MSASGKTRLIVDPHRHAFGSAMAKKIAQAGLYHPSAPFPQAGAGDIVVYRVFIDLDFALHRQRQSGVTHTLISSGGEIPWIAGEVLKADVASAIDALTDDDLDEAEISGRISIMADPHALDEGCRPAVERAFDRHTPRRSRSLAVMGTARSASFWTGRKPSGYVNSRPTRASSSTFTRR